MSSSIKIPNLEFENNKLKYIWNLYQESKYTANIDHSPDPLILSLNPDEFLSAIYDRGYINSLDKFKEIIKKSDSYVGSSYIISAHTGKRIRVFNFMIE